MNDKLIEKYTNIGILRDKIKFIVDVPCVTYSISRKILVNQSNYLELIENKLTFENNRQLNLMCRTIPEIEKINNSKGIIIMENEKCFRYLILPTE